MNNYNLGSIDNLRNQLQNQLAQLDNLSSSMKKQGVGLPNSVKSGTSMVGAEQSMNNTNNNSPVVTQNIGNFNQKLLFDLYQEFLITDEGKALAAGLQKFARFAQSRVNKGNNPS